MRQRTDRLGRPCDSPSVAASGATANRRAQLDQRLFARVQAGDRRAREQLIERYLPLARSVARRYQGPAQGSEDLYQVASLGLVKAIDRYDPARGCAFSSYAVPTIAGELRRYFRDRTWIVRPPRELQEVALRLDRATDRLSQQHDRSPSVRELAAAVGETDELVLEALQARGARVARSLQASTSREDEHASLYDTLGLSDDGYENAETRVLLDQLLACVSLRSREVVRLRFEHDLTQAEIAARVGVSQMQVSRLLRAALQRMRDVARQQQVLTDGVTSQIP